MAVKKLMNDKEENKEGNNSHMPYHIIEMLIITFMYISIHSRQ